MARIRSVKPEFWIDRGLARALSRDARLLYIALWNQADEHARLHGDPRYVKGQCFPYDDDLSLADIDRLLDELAASGRVQRYVAGGDPYLFLPKLASHQRLESDKVSSRLPDPPPPSPERPSPQPPNPSESGADKSAPRADRLLNGNSEQVSSPAETPSESGADLSARGADSSTLLYVAGGREQVAGTASLRAARAAPPSPTESPGQQANRITKIYTDRVKLTRFPAAMKIVRKALNVGYPETDVAAALDRLADDNRSLTVETLRIELDGPATARASPRRESTTDARVGVALELAERYAAEEAAEQTRQLAPGGAA
jgi:hypothetical protein